MNEQQIKELRKNILSRISDGILNNGKGTFDNQDVISLYFLNDDMAALLRTGIASHEYAAEYIRVIQNFYSRITPDEIKILNTKVYPCETSGNLYTQDEFYPLLKIPDRIGVRYQQNDDTEEMFTLTAKQHTHEHKLWDIGNRPGFVYLARMGENSFKIGNSRQPFKRVKNLKGEFICAINVNDRYRAESDLHNLFLHKWISGELFSLDYKDVKYIQELAS